MQTQVNSRPARGTDAVPGLITQNAEQGWPGRLAAPFEALAASRSFWLLALGSAFVIGPAVLPVRWSGNEIVYFDLAYRSVLPDGFTDAHAMFDASKSRIVAMMAIGVFIKALGFEAAKTVLALMVWAAYALGLAAVARGLGMRVADLVLALVVFILAQQTLVGGEWIFGTVEPKVLAYGLVFFGFAAALAGRWLLMTALLAVATYVHFLVGGAWMMFFLLLSVMMGPQWRKLAGLFGLYTVLVLPIVAILIAERGGLPVDTSALGDTVDRIYALYRAPLLVAPFAKGLTGFGLGWLPGLSVHAALSFILFWFAAEATGRDRVILRWAGILNALLLVAALAALIDSQTHHLAKFLIFRPSAMVLLLSCLLLARWLFLLPIPKVDRLGGAVLILVVALQLPAYLAAARHGYSILAQGSRLEWQMTADERDILRWISQNTPEDAAILAESPADSPLSEGDDFPLGLERLSGRGMIVFFKNVPADTADFVRWYQLLVAKKAFFGGDCSQIAVLGADFVIFQSRDSLAALGDCTELVYSNKSFLVARTRPLP